MSNKNKYLKRAGGSPDRKRFLINAAVLFAAVGLVAWRMPSWGFVQILVLVLLAGMAAFQILLFFLLK